MKKILCASVLVFACSFTAQSRDEQVGKVYTYDAKEGSVVISSPRAAEQFKLGDRLCIKRGDARIVLRVSFPMMATAKCRVEKGSAFPASSVVKGEEIYRYQEERKETVKFFETWDADYLNKTKKIRFVRELDAKKALAFKKYFEVTFDARGNIVKTLEKAGQRPSAVDYYKDEKIIKKEQYNTVSGKVTGVNTYEYHPNGGLKRMAIVDYVKNTDTVYEYDENGTYIPSSQK